MGPLLVSAKVIVYSSPISKILLVAIPISKTGISAELLIAFPYQQNVQAANASNRTPSISNENKQKYVVHITYKNRGMILINIQGVLYKQYQY